MSADDFKELREKLAKLSKMELEYEARTSALCDMTEKMVKDPTQVDGSAAENESRRLWSFRREIDALNKEVKVLLARADAEASTKGLR